MTADTDEESSQELVNILRKYLTKKDGQTVLKLITAISSAPPDHKYTTVLSVADNQKRTAFHHAAVRGDTEVCGGILDSIAEEQKYRLLQLQDRSGETAISLAAYYGHDGLVKALLQKAQQNFRYDLLKVQNDAGQTALHTAACKGQGKVIRCIADCLTEHLWYMLLTIQDSKGNTAIALAAYFGHAKTVCSILDAVNSDKQYEILLLKNSDGQSSLHKAANNGHTDALKPILASLKKLQMWELLMLQDNYGNTPIALAAYHDHTLTVQLILHSVEPGRRYEMICVLNKARQSILHIAAGKGDMETLRSIKDVLSPHQLLVQLMQKDENGNTVVACAVLNGRREAVQWVLERGTAIDMLKIWNTKGQSVLHKVAYEGNAIGLRSIIDSVMDYQRSFLLMQKDSSGNTVIACAAHNGHIETVKYILSSAVDVSLRHSMLKVQNLMGQSTLHRAAYNGHTEIVKASMSSITKEQKYKLLLQKDNQGYIPLALAAHRGHVNILRDIISSIGGDQKYNLLSQRNEDGKTAIALAAYRGHSEAVRYMLRITTDSNRKYQMLEDCNVNGLSILHTAALSGSTDILSAITNSFPAEQVHKLLMLLTSNGDTALAFAADEGHSEMAKLILQCIKDHAEKYDMLYVQNRDGLSPVHRAAGNGHTHVLEVLMNDLSPEERYTMLTQLDYAGYDAIHLAECGRHAKTAKYLHTVLEETHYRRCTTSEEGRNDLLSIDCIASNAAEEMEGERQASPIPGTHRENSRDEQTNLRCRITELEEQNRDLTELVQQLRGLLEEKENKIEKQPAVTKELKDEAKQVDETTDVMTDHREEDTELEEKIERMADRKMMLNKGLTADQAGGTEKSSSDEESSGDELDYDEFAIPVALKALLGGLCTEYGVEKFLFHQNPEDHREILIVGKNATKLTKGVLEEFKKGHDGWSSYTISSQELDEKDQTRQFMHSKIEGFTRAPLKGFCELIAEAKPSANADRIDTFVVGPAHMMFDEQTNEELRRGVGLKKARDQIEMEPSHTGYWINFRADGGDERTMTASHPPMIGYRYKINHSNAEECLDNNAPNMPGATNFTNLLAAANSTNSDQEAETRNPVDSPEALDCNLCLNDMVLLPIQHAEAEHMHRELKRHRVNRTEKLIEINTRNLLRKYILFNPNKKIPIKVKDREGILLRNTLDIGDQIASGEAFYLRFKLNEGSAPLDYGDSGSVVWRVMRGGKLKPLGMLIGTPDGPFRQDQYQAAILSTAFKDIETFYHRRVDEILLFNTTLAERQEDGKIILKSTVRPPPQ